MTTAPYSPEIEKNRLAASRVIRVTVPLSRKAFLLNGAADPILAMASAPHTAVQPSTGGLKFKARK